MHSSTTRSILTPHATWLGTGALLAFTVGSYLLLTMGDTPKPSNAARFMACGVGLGLAASVLFDYLAQGVRNLFRADIVCLFALYFLTLVEFLFEQPDFDETVTRSAVNAGLLLVVIAISTLSIARHMCSPRQAVYSTPAQVDAALLFKLLLLSAGLGYLYRLLSVNFDPVALFDAMVGPRFAVPWGRGRLGDWRALLSELELMLYLIPPLFAVLWTRRAQLSTTQISIGMFIFAFTLFSGFCSGTRNIFAVYVATFVVSYVLSAQRNSFKGIVVVSSGAMALLMFASYHMLEFRQSGLRHYLSHETYQSDETRDTLFIDYNLLAISELTTKFPETYDYIGIEVPVWALVRPIPRAIWPGKPEGLSIGIEEALGAEGLTIATTYIGESFMAQGTFGVVLASIFFGFVASWWNRTGGANGDSPISSVLYASGFFALAISMRSLFMFTTAALPTIALFVLAATLTPTSTPSGIQLSNRSRAHGPGKL